jgi:hypothetical protein
MATRQYNKTARTQTTGLSKLIENLISTGTLSGQRRPKRISDRTVDNMEDLRQNFHPTNIGQALGRKAAGMFMNMFKGDDKKNNVKGKKGRAKEAKENKKNNPLYTKVAEGNERPVRNNDSLSDVLGKIHNLLKLNIERTRKEHRLEKNFAKEKEDEREKRHQELVKAIGGLTGGTATKVEEKGKNNLFGSLIDNVMKAFEDFKKLFEPLLDFARIIKKTGFETLSRFLAVIGTDAMLAFLLPAAAAAALLWLANKNKEEIEANPNDPKFKNNPYAMTLRGEAKSLAEAGKRNENELKLQVPRNQIDDAVKANLPKEDYEQIYGATKEVLQTWLDKSKDEKGAKWQKPVRNEKGQITTKAGPVGSDLRVSAVELSGQTTETARTAGSAPGSYSSVSPDYLNPAPEIAKPPVVDRSARRIQATQEEQFYQEEVKAANLKPTAEPTPPAPDRSSKRLQAAIEEQFYQDEVKAAKRSVTINSPKTVVGGSTQVQSLNIEESAPVRIDDPTLKHIQERNLRRF